MFSMMTPVSVMAGGRQIQKGRRIMRHKDRTFLFSYVPSTAYYQNRNIVWRKNNDRIRSNWYLCGRNTGVTKIIWDTIISCVTVFILLVIVNYTTFFSPMTFRLTKKLLTGCVLIWHSYLPESRFCAYWI